jgi:DNA-binding cell septation regulator SpoVG
MDSPRAQPWKAFCNPESQDFRDLAASLPSQSSKGIVDAALKNYAAENEKDDKAQVLKNGTYPAHTSLLAVS